MMCTRRGSTKGPNSYESMNAGKSNIISTSAKEFDHNDFYVNVTGNFGPSRKGI